MRATGIGHHLHVRRGSPPAGQALLEAAVGNLRCARVHAAIIRRGFGEASAELRERKESPHAAQKQRRMRRTEVEESVARELVRTGTTRSKAPQVTPVSVAPTRKFLSSPYVQAPRRRRR